MFAPVEQSLPLDCGKYTNRNLFAEHFLSHPQRLRAMEEWKQEQGLPEALERIRKIYRKHASRFNSHTNEAQTERDFIRPVLDVLWGSGCYQVQVSIPNVEGRRQPDYAFFRTAEARQEADKRKGSLEYWRDVPALGDAKAWESSLDRQGSTGENPSAQISNYLYRSRVRWGILTNGRLWRLYERDKSSAGGIYYEVNLADLLERGDTAVFKYFYLFFRREAFIPDAKTGLSFVEKVFKESADYATGVGERLRESVYDALRHLMNGFLAHPANGLDSGNSQTAELVHENSLILLYRLLFILYAEDYGILPCEMPQYSIYSLRALHKEINEKLLSKPYPATPTSLWFRLCSLFTLIDGGFEDGGNRIVLAYNGGLFSPERYPHIAHLPQANFTRWQIGDRYLAEAIDLLAYDRKQWNKPTSDDVDYATLDVQHLGSIYEGLLELQPHVAAEPLVETTDKGKAVFRPEREVAQPKPIRGQPPRAVKTGEVYLVTNRGERKATGSYYTPKYIVDYIVENTVGPLAEEAAKKVAELSADVEREIKKLERTRREWEKSSAREAPEHIAGLHKLIGDQKRRLLEPYLALKILDPAMGSGHFLVGAADHLSLNMATDPNLIPPEETDSENVQAFYKRLIVERCLYGVDLNPLAVELAKLSLWLHTVSKGKALSFLDHHLRCGNSLIGARIEDDLMKTPPQFDERGRRIKGDGEQLVLGLYEALHERHLVALLDLLHKITDVPTHDAATEKLKEGYYASLELGRERYRAVANCWLAPFFGVAVDPEHYQEAVAALRGADAQWDALTQLAWFQAAQAAAQHRRFFHWELEFPEVFFHKHGFKPKEQRGFDIVIGNPPYGMPQDERLKSLANTSYESAEGRDDYYKLFTERGLGLARDNGTLSFITSNAILSNRFDAKIRRLLLNNCCWRKTVTFAFPVFDEPTVHTCIILIAKRQPADNVEMEILHRISDPSDLSKKGKCVRQRLFLEDATNMIAPVGDGRIRAVLKKIEEMGQPLGQIAHIRQCIKTGNDALYLQFSARPLPEPWKSVLGGEDVYRYTISWPQRYLKHGEWLARNWQNPDFFAREKIVIRETSKRITAALDSRQYYLLSSLYSLYYKSSGPEEGLPYLLALLNSSLSQFFMQHLVFGLSTGAFIKARTNHYARLPIRRIAFTTPKAERARLVKRMKEIYHSGIEKLIREAGR